MDKITIFFAYPSISEAIGETITAAAQNCKRYLVGVDLTTWRESDIAGRFIAEEVLNRITASSCLAADITSLNFNVTYEVGYAIGAKRKIILTRNRALKDDAVLRTELGIFDTLGYQQYENSQQLLDIIKSVSDLTPLAFDSSNINMKAPVYLLEPKFKTDQATRVRSRVKRARLFFRSFDPSEQPRLSAHDAIRNVAQSAGVLLQLTKAHNADANLNNLRAAFLAGLAHGMGKVTTILQDGEEPIPIDYRDLVTAYTHPGQIDEAIEDFAVRVVEAFQGGPSRIKGPRSFLAGLTLGASSAENEFRDLGEYYLQTAQFLRAARGEARLVVGRKGSGKTAVFAQVRDQIRTSRTNIVLDLKPEGYKLRKFNEVVGDLLTEGTREHTVMAFWEYLLLLEICYKILEKDEIPHTRNHTLYEPYRRLAETYQSDEYISEGDFSERMTVLLKRITHDYSAKHGEEAGTVLNQAQVTELIYRHDVIKLREEMQAYMSHKNELWILIDNLDKGWPTHGITDEDLVVIRALLEATRKLERDFQRARQNCHTIVFLRNDVYELLVEETPDRGKESKVVLDWTDPELLREVLRRRLVFNDLSENARFDEVWPQICVSHIDGQESSQYLIERCLMRPRCLIDLVDHCRAHAVNLQRERIGRDDLEQGLAAFSSDLLVDIGYEIRDVALDADQILYAFLGVAKELSISDFELILAEAEIDETSLEQVTDILLWYGFLGVMIGADESRYIYSVNYDMRRLKGLMAKGGRDHVRYCINPAFWPALEVH